MTDEEFSTERWVYKGEDRDSGNKRVAIFLAPDGHNYTLSWKTAYNSLASGYIYEIQANETKIRGDFKWTGDKADDFDEIRMQNRAREMEREERSMEAKARKQDGDLEALLAQVAEYAARYKKTSSKNALIQLLSRAVWRS
jgi:hypothetical protein